MSRGTRFRNLVINVYMEHWDYYRRRFAFNTVFYCGPFSYRCCICSYEFEYLEFISDNGEIHEDIYEKILKCILDGQCPHVEGARADHVVETEVYGIHVAAAVGTERAVEQRYPREFSHTRIFKVCPLLMSLLKNKPNMLRNFRDIMYLPIGRQIFRQASRLCAGQNTLIFEKCNFIEICIFKRFPDLLKIFFFLVCSYHGTRSCL